MEITYRKATSADMDIMTDLLFLLYHNEGQAPDLSREDLLAENEQLFADTTQIFFLAFDCLLDNTDSYNFHLKIGYEETERCVFFLKPIDVQLVKRLSNENWE
jgi:hypothetical protein